MRQVFVHVARGYGPRVLDAASRCDGSTASVAQVRSEDGEPLDLALVHVPNSKVGPLLRELGDLPGLHFSLIPSASLAVKSPQEGVPEEARDVTPRSPFEIYSAGLQSISGWGGLLAYAVAGSVLVWLGLATDSVFLLVGAMLIAPFAGPAMNAAVATARGDAALLGHALLRYAVALAVTVTVAALLSLVFRHDVVTRQMEVAAKVSSATLLLPLAAGAAGALHLCQSERSNLVSGAASGLLIAASLAPPAALLGMATVVGEWELLPSAAFLLGLQLVGINLVGTLTFRVYGVRTTVPRFGRGRSMVTVLSLAASAAALAALLVWQYRTPGSVLQRASVETRLRGVVLGKLGDMPGISPAEVDVRFARAPQRREPTVLVTAYVERLASGGPPDVELRDQLTVQLRDAVERAGHGVKALVSVTWIDAPTAASNASTVR